MSFDNRPDSDQVYLAERIGDTWGKPLSIAALQKLNTTFGRVVVTDALRMLRGFPPEKVISPYAYLKAVCTVTA
jgi:hypothetical protein